MSGASSLTVGDLRFEIRYGAVAEPAVYVEGEALVLEAPQGADEAALSAFVRARELWIYKRLLEQDAFSPSEAPYAEGDRRLYLGRRHQLRLVEGAVKPLKLNAGRFELRAGLSTAEARGHFIAWYTARATPWLKKKVASWGPQLDQPSLQVEVRDLGFRWSSRKGDLLRFHWALIQAPPPVAEYVVVHELAHAVDRKHSEAFWGAVATALPDYTSRRAWLEAHGAELAAR